MPCHAVYFVIEILMYSKSLVTGPPCEGSLLSTLIAKVSSLCAKAGPFDAILSLGVFATAADEDVQQLLNGSLKCDAWFYVLACPVAHSFAM